jgi:flagellar hook-basal body complex protein FliE
MAIDAINAVSPMPTQLQAGAPAQMANVDFRSVLDGGLAQVDQGLKAADQQVRALAAGHEIAPHEVMISMEQARMHLTLLVEVRNRVVEAYQELARMQL